MSTCLLTWTAMPLHAQTQPDAGTAPSQEQRPAGQAPSQERMQPKTAPGEGTAPRGRAAEQGQGQGQAEQERPGGQEPGAQRKGAPGEAQKARNAPQPENAATGQRSTEAPEAQRGDASGSERQQTDESGRKRQPGEGEGAGKRRAGEAARPATPDETKAQSGGEERTKPKADQAGQRDQKPQNTESPTKPGERTGAEPNRADGARGEPPKASGAGAGTGMAADAANGGSVRAEGKVRLDERQASAFHSRIVDRYRGESTHVDVDLSVGVAIPAAVRLRPVPTEIVSEYPEFRDYDFFVEDDEVVIVEPRTREVVEIVGGGGRRTVGAREGGPRLGRDRIAEITRVISSDRAALAEGGRGPMLRAPADAVLRPLPDRIASGMPDAAAYGYFVDREGRVVVVDRATREVLDLVE